MRTTLDLEKPVLDGLKALGKKEKISLGKIASRLLAEAMSKNAAKNRGKQAFHWIAAPMGAKVNLADKDAVARAMEGR